MVKRGVLSRDLHPLPLTTFARLPGSTQPNGSTRTTGLAACDGESTESSVEESREKNRSHTGR
jgi:hypothetical protein